MRSLCAATFVCVALTACSGVLAETAGKEPPPKTGSRLAGWVSETLRPVGFGVPIGLYLSGSDRDRRAARRIANAELLANGVTEIIKEATDQPRPRDPGAEDGLPSGHATTAWALATVLGHEYPAHEEAFYGYAALMTWSRRAGRYHTWAQALAGAVVGWGCARLELNSSDGLLLHVSDPPAQGAEELLSSLGPRDLVLPSAGLTVLDLHWSF